MSVSIRANADGSSSILNTAGNEIVNIASNGTLTTQGSLIVNVSSPTPITYQTSGQAISLYIQNTSTTDNTANSIVGASANNGSNSIYLQAKKTGANGVYANANAVSMEVGTLGAAPTSLMTNNVDRFKIDSNGAMTAVASGGGNSLLPVCLARAIVNFGGNDSNASALGLRRAIGVTNVVRNSVGNYTGTLAFDLDINAIVLATGYDTSGYNISCKSAMTSANTFQVLTGFEDTPGFASIDQVNVVIYY